MELFFSIIEYVGIVSFAISGTLFALNKKTDIIGALVFSFLTSFGGGIIRDFTLGLIPPRFFTDPAFIGLEIVCLVVSTLLFHCAFSKKVMNAISRHKHDFWLELTDAIGLAVFVVIGVDCAIEAGFANNALVLIFSGCISGVGGGMLRDICSATIPRILHKHVYLLPCVLGAILYVFTKSDDVLGRVVSTIFTLVLIIGLRVLACIYKWNLPRPGTKIGEGEKKEN